MHCLWIILVQTENAERKSGIGFLSQEIWELGWGEKK